MDGPEPLGAPVVVEPVTDYPTVPADPAPKPPEIARGEQGGDDV